MAVDYASAIIDWTGQETTLLELMKGRAGLCDGDSSQDDMYTLYLTMAGELAEKHIDNKLVQQEVTERIAIPYSPIALRYWPAEEPTLITLEGDDVTEQYDTYVQDGIRWIVRNGKSCADSFQQLDVTYLAGFDPVPSDVAYAITGTGLSYEIGAGNVSGAVTKEVVNGVGSITYDSSGDSEGSVGPMSSAAVTVIEKYRRYHV